MTQPRLSPGQVAYHAYGRAVDWLNFQGDSMPPWDKLPDRIRAAWEAAALAVQP
jgi:hypothetical protein